MFTKLLMQMPDASRPDDFALTAVRELDSLDKSAGTAKLSEPEHLIRASVYQFNRDFAAARAHYQTLIDRIPRAARSECDSPTRQGFLPGRQIRRRDQSFSESV